MTRKKQIQSGEKLPLKLTVAQRKLVLEGLTGLDQQIERIVRVTPAGQPVMMSLDDLDYFGGYIAAEGSHCDDLRKGRTLDAILEKIDSLLDSHADEELPQTVKIEDARNAKVISDQAVQIAAWAAKALVAAEQLGIKTKPLEHFWLAPAQRDVLLLVPGVTQAIKNKLAKEKASFTVTDVASMTMALAEDLLDGDARKQVAVLFVAKHLMDHLQERIIGTTKATDKKKPKAKSKVANDTLFQFKITLLDSKPLIWRRIQVTDGTLDELHEHIQTSMGWTNSHLHHFRIGEQLYGDPMLMEESMEEMDYKDSTRTRISKIVPKTGKRLSFMYEYDFGDGWEHDVLFEGCPQKEPGQKYPLCLEGERACPPEDVGGIGGFYEFLDAIGNKRHKQHKEMLEWIVGDFDPEKFDAKQATSEMKKGLPEWRE